MTIMKFITSIVRNTFIDDIVTYFPVWHSIQHDSE